MKSVHSLVLLSVLTLASATQQATLAGGGTAEVISANSDLGRIQGRWTAVAGAKRLVQVTLEVQGRDVDAFITLPRGVKLRAHGELRIDETTSPRTLDWVKFNGPDDADLPDILGIYKLENDTLTVVNGGLHGARPREFKPAEGLLGELVTFRRPSNASSDKTVKR